MRVLTRRVTYAGMAAPHHPPPASPGPRRGAFLDHMIDGLLLAGLVLVFLRVAVPGFKGWYHEDDFHNLRWAMEYRYEPWKALTERHSLHDHIRPMTLMTLWFGTYLADGQYWGQHLMLVLLHALGLAGVVALGRALHGRLRTGLLAGLIVSGVWGWERLLDWNALMNTAGEVAFGLWALVALRRGLTRPGWLVLGAALIVLSGLYKEPGSVLYPIAALAMGWGAWRRGESPRRPLIVASTVLLGAATFAFTWAQANVARMDAVAMPLGERVLLFLQSHASGLISAWPGDYHDGKMASGLAGVPAALFALVAIKDLIGPTGMARRELQYLWLAASGLAWLAVAVHPLLVGDLLFPTVIALLIRRWREPPIGLVLYVVSVTVMAPFAQGSEVQILGGTYGLALYIAVSAAEALERKPGEGWAAPLGVASGLLLSLALTGVRLSELPADVTWASQRQSERSLLGWGAVARTLGVNHATAMGMSITDQEALPLVGIGVDEGGNSRAAMVSVDGQLLINPPPGAVQRALTANAVSTRPGALSTPMNLAPGWWALGVGSGGSASGGAPLALRATDTCRNTWTVSPLERVAVRYSLVPLYLSPGCAPLTLRWVGDADAVEGQATLVPLQDPIVSLWHPIEIERRLPVKRRTNEFAR